MFAFGKPASLAISAWVLRWNKVADAVSDQLCGSSVLYTIVLDHDDPLPNGYTIGDICA
jgi:hypothetical protein